MSDSVSSDPDQISWLLLLCFLASCVIQGLGFVHGFLAQTEVFFDFLGGFNSLTFIFVAGWVLEKQHSEENENINVNDNQNQIPIPADEETLFRDPRKLVSAILFGLSRLWLLSFLFMRAKSRGGDGRFDELKTSFWKYLGVSTI